MKLTLRRIATNNDETYGVLYVDGKYSGRNIFCHTLEDQHQETKIANETCIPSGTYDIKLRPIMDGNVNARYTDLFPSMHRGMLWLQDVPGFTWIYIHIGNTDDHTSGCILVGQQGHINNQGIITLNRSTAAYTHLYKSVVKDAENGTLSITIIDDE